MFAPDPLQENLYVTSEIHFKDGTLRQVALPRLGQMSKTRATLEKRYRKFQQNIVGSGNAYLRADVARYLARRHSTRASTPIRVEIFMYKSLIPRHDRDEIREQLFPKWIDYWSRLNDPSTYVKTSLLNYEVQEADLHE